jgi:kynurenine formamidase
MTLPPEFTDLAQKVSNWGRWGPDDERGTLNLIDEAAVRRGGAAVKTGARISLSIPYDERGPQTGAIRGRINPLRTMVAIDAALTKDPAGARNSDDVVVMGLQAATHWDSLAHVTYDGRMYNGHPPTSIDGDGARRCGIDKFGPVVSRGVLLDVAAATGVERAEGAITPEDLDAAESHAGVRVEPGDIVLIRTGQMRVLREGNRKAYLTPAPGLGMASVLWLRERDVAAAASDTLMFEVYPCEREDCFLAVHMLCIVEMGLPLGENFDLESLAAACAADGNYACLLEASPLPFTRGLGGPVNPIAIR